MTKAELAALKGVRRKLAMDNGEFSTGMPGDRVTAPDGRRMQPTDFIIGETKLWRESWVLPQLDRIIAKYEQRHQKQKRGTR